MDYKENIYVKRLPKHLRKFIVEQTYDSYTPIDHAVWRYIMRANFSFLSKHAHHSYIKGLKKTGLSIEKIPNINEMNDILSRIGWGAVCVDGFIPPSAFMEFQAFNVLVIAADIRNINHLTYTPAPDIVHEAAGHAPIIGDSQYAEYLRLFGEIGSKALGSKRDYELYQAIRKLSILKESPTSIEEEIVLAEKEIEDIQKDMGEASELAQIRNLHWWTVEYGLIGSLQNPKLYGAGLLSSIGESAACLHDSVKKIPYSIEAAKYAFDITTQQPHLFVTPDFNHLTKVLNDFADTMALRKGGLDSVKKAIQSESVATCELSSGLQISGIFSNCFSDDKGDVAYLQTKGPTMLCERERMLIGHSTNEHPEGFGTPVGKLKNCDKAIEEMTSVEFQKFDIQIGKELDLEFESGVIVHGEVCNMRRNKFGKMLILTFNNCTVKFKETVLFEPSWGRFDMAVGASVVSVFSGAADKDEMDLEDFVSSIKTIHADTHDSKYLHLYKEVRDLRESNSGYHLLEVIFNTLISQYPNDWLLSIEIYELVYHFDSKNLQLLENVKNYLLDKTSQSEELKKLILDGISLIEI